MGVHVVEAPREAPAQGREQDGRKRLAAADVVLEEAALALVDAARDAAVQDGAVIAGVDVLLVHGVAALVQHRVDVADDVVLVDVRGDVGVRTADRVGEGVLGLGERECARPQPLQLKQVAGKLHLRIVVERPLDAGAARLPAPLADGGNHRHDALLYLREERVIEGAGRPTLKVVQQRVVGVVVRAA